MLHIISINHHHRQWGQWSQNQISCSCTHFGSTKSVNEVHFRKKQEEVRKSIIKRTYHCISISTCLHNFQSPLWNLPQSQNHDCGITVKLTLVLLPYDLSLMGIQKMTQCALNVSRPSTGGRSSKSRLSSEHSHLSWYIPMWVDHSPCLASVAITTISYSSMITHPTSLFVASQIRSPKCAPLPTNQIEQRRRKTQDIYWYNHHHALTTTKPPRRITTTTLYFNKHSPPILYTFPSKLTNWILQIHSPPNLNNALNTICKWAQLKVPSLRGPRQWDINHHKASQRLVHCIFSLRPYLRI